MTVCQFVTAKLLVFLLVDFVLAQKLFDLQQPAVASLAVVVTLLQYHYCPEAAVHDLGEISLKLKLSSSQFKSSSLELSSLL